MGVRRGAPRVGSHRGDGHVAPSPRRCFLSAVAHFRCYPTSGAWLFRSVFSKKGLIWPSLVSFTPNREVENEATVASSGSPFTRTHWAKRGHNEATLGLGCSFGDGDKDARFPSARERRGCSGVVRSGETFNSVPFRSISFHFLSLTRGRDARFRLLETASVNQCRGWRGDGAMGSCRWFARWGFITLTHMRLDNYPLHADTIWGFFEPITYHRSRNGREHQMQGTPRRFHSQSA